MFATWPGLETDSAGLADDAECPVALEQVEWADVIIVMEKVHRRRLTQRFGSHLRGKRVVCLDLPDDYEFMDAGLIALLEQRVSKLARIVR